MNIDTNATLLSRPVNLIRRQTLARKLENVKALGTIPIKIRRFFTDNVGTILTKAGGLIPAALQLSYPVYMLGAFDQAGGFKIGGLAVPPKAGTYFLMSYIKGNYVNPLLDFSGFNSVNAQIGAGDLVGVFTDSLTAPGYFIFIVQSIDYAGLGSILADSVHENLAVDSINYQVAAAQVAQFNEQLKFDTGNILGSYKENSVNPLEYRTPQDYQNGLINVLVDFTLSLYLGINFYMQYDTDLITMNLKIKF